MSSDEETLHTALKNSAEMKDEGNASFMAKNWTSAITAYNQALACLPSHIPVVVTTNHHHAEDQGPPNSADATRIKDPNRDVDSLMEEGSFNSSKQPGSTESQSRKITPLEEACSHARVILHSNIAACELKLVRLRPYTSLYTHESVARRRRRKLGKLRSKLPRQRSRKILITIRLFGGEQKPMNPLTLGLLSHQHKKVLATPAMPAAWHIHRTFLRLQHTDRNCATVSTTLSRRFLRSQVFGAKDRGD
jgi:hypothetical protein